jgi:MFS family permease
MQGAVQGYAGSAGAVASILGLIVGGVLYGFLEQRVFLLAALIIVTVFVEGENQCSICSMTQKTGGIIICPSYSVTFCKKNVKTSFELRNNLRR